MIWKKAVHSGIQTYAFGGVVPGNIHWGLLIGGWNDWKNKAKKIGSHTIKYILIYIPDSKNMHPELQIIRGGSGVYSGLLDIIFFSNSNVSYRRLLEDPRTWGVSATNSFPITPPHTHTHHWAQKQLLYTVHSNAIEGI